MKLNKTGITDEVRDVAAKIGWRQMLFTNKLQLRVGLFYYSAETSSDHLNQCVILFLLLLSNKLLKSCLETC